MKNRKTWIIIGLLALVAFMFILIWNQTNQTLTETSVDKEITATAIGNISYKQIQKDASTDAIIDSSQKLDNGNLLVNFHHNSGKEEPVSIIGNVRYELSKATAKPNEVITLTVFDWSTEYFEIKVGQQISIIRGDANGI